MLVVAGIAGYATGAFTGEIHREESCPVCRTIRVSGSQYGFAYNRLEENEFTQWYRATIDPKHGLDAAHPHQFEPSNCTTVVRAWHGDVDYNCTDYAPLFILRPEIELEAVRRIADKPTQVAFMASLGSKDRSAASKRVRLLMEWYHAERDKPWEAWWSRHAAEFGLRAPKVAPSATKPPR